MEKPDRYKQNGHTQHDAGPEKAQGFAKNHPYDGAALRSKGDTDADFAGALGYAGGQQTI